jgi:hypothetical protein
MTRTRFRFLILLSVSTSLLSVVLSFTATSHSAELAGAYAREPGPSWVEDHPWLFITGALAYILLYAAGTIGLYRFLHWARPLSLYLTLAGLLLLPVLSASLLSPLEYMLQAVSGLSWGAVLALAYWSPLSTQFEQPAAVADCATSAA